MLSSIIKTFLSFKYYHFVPKQVVTVIHGIHTAFGFSAGINKGSCFRINHFPEDNDYDTDSSEYILRKSMQPLHLQTLQLLIPASFFIW